MALSDSIDKIVEAYFSSVTDEPFEFKGKWFLPKPLVVSPLIFRDYSCRAYCGACCLKVSLDYLPFENQQSIVENRIVQISGKEFIVHSNLQKGNETHYCQYLDLISGSCMVHDYNPMSCAFALLAFTQHKDKNYLSLRKFGRSWSLTRVTGEKGSACELLPPSPKRILDTIKQLKRLEAWTDYFVLKTKLPQVIEYVSTGPHEKPITI